MSDLWIVQVSAEREGRAFNVIVSDAARERAEATAIAAVSSDGWSDVELLRSGMVAEDRMAQRDQVFRDAAQTARDLGWAIIRYTPTT